MTTTQRPVARTRAIAQAKREAAAKASRHNHVLGRWVLFGNDDAAVVAYCAACHMTATVRWPTTDETNEVVWGGRATEQHCSPPTKPAARPLTLSAIKSQFPREVWSLTERDSRGNPRRYSTGSLKLWKRTPDKFRLSLHYGIKAHDWYYVTDERDLATLSADDPSSHHYPMV